jgi:hypothetical protein
MRDMNSSTELISKSRTILGDGTEIVAAGIFGLQDDPPIVSVAGVAGAGVGDLLAADPAVAAATGAGAIHAARATVAASQGLTVRMLVALSDTRIHILDWMTGTGPTRVMLSFERARTEVRVKRFGLSRRLMLRDTVSGRTLALTGTTAFFASESKGDKSVLRLLEPPH